MSENSPNTNIFEGAPGSLRDALPLFSRIEVTALPLQPEEAGAARLYTLAQVQEGGQPALPAFTGEDLLYPPFVKKSLADTAALFFHAPGHETFVFNPSHPKARFSAAPFALSRNEISLLAGYIRMAGKNIQGDHARLAAGEFAMGNLHAAHYLYDLAVARNPASGARFQLGSVLVELGLLQEAYDSLKNDTDPEALLALAVIHRKTGNAAMARKNLAAIGPGALDEKKAIESAWLDLEEGKDEEAEKVFQRLSASAFDKAETLSGLGAAMAKKAFRTKDKSRLAAAAAVLRSALNTPSQISGRIFFQLGNLYFRSGDAAQAEACYRRSAALAPAVQALANLALTLLKTGKQAEAAAVTAQVALTDIASARRLTAEFPKESLAGLFRTFEQPPSEPEPARRPDPTVRASPAPAQEPKPGPGAPSAPAPAQKTPSGLETAAGNYQFINPLAKPRQGVPDAPPPITRTQQQFPEIYGTKQETAAPSPAPQFQIETFNDVMSSAAQPTEEESRKDDFISRAFTLASDLEDELGRKIYFNLDGLGEAERRLRLKFIKAGANPQGGLETVRDCAAFLCYFFQERLKGRLIKMADFDPWGWPMVFERPDRKIITYPVQRAWRLLWEETVPEPGWLIKYAHWLSDKLKETAPPVCGAAAARAKTQSHPERIIDAQTEHKRMMVLNSSLSETSGIEIGRTGLLKLENAIKNNFRPNIPPTTDGWKLLRCYGHVLAAILAKDFKASWYNVDGDDGGWSMQTPWRTFVFPLGKVYKTASLRDGLDEYYEVLLAEKLKYQPGPRP